MRRRVVALRATVGGGSLPGETLPSVGLALARGRRSASRLAARCATGDPIVIGRIEDGPVVLDLRTVDPDQDDATWPRPSSGPSRRAMTVVVGTAGHIDHGKTTLLRALTGIDADRLPEERRRGMTIDVGYAHLTLADGTVVDFVDVPGHDRLVGNMLVGAGEIDAVAARRGRRRRAACPDARAPRAARRLGVPPRLVVVTKVDAVEPDRVDEVVARGPGARRAGCCRSCRVSALTGAGMDGGPRGAGRGGRRGAGGCGPAGDAGHRSGLRGQGPRRGRHRDAPRRAAGDGRSPAPRAR